jgi:hypothetical protein
MANSVVQAEKADFDKPTNVEATQMSYDEKKQINIFILQKLSMTLIIWKKNWMI